MRPPACRRSSGWCRGACRWWCARCTPLRWSAIRLGPPVPPPSSPNGRRPRNSCQACWLIMASTSRRGSSFCPVADLTVDEVEVARLVAEAGPAPRSVSRWINPAGRWMPDHVGATQVGFWRAALQRPRCGPPGGPGAGGVKRPVTCVAAGVVGGPCTVPLGTRMDLSSVSELNHIHIVDGV